jgi:hypothetical protein
MGASGDNDPQLCREEEAGGWGMKREESGGFVQALAANDAVEFVYKDILGFGTLFAEAQVIEKCRDVPSFASFYP